MLLFLGNHSRGSFRSCAIPHKHLQLGQCQNEENGERKIKNITQKLSENFELYKARDWVQNKVWRQFWQPIYSEKYKYNKNAKKYEKEVEEKKGEHIQYTGSDDDGWIAEPWSIFKKAFSIFGKHQASWQMANRFAIYSKITIRNQKQIKLEPTVEHVVGLVDSLECLRMYVCVYICYIWYV